MEKLYVVDESDFKEEDLYNGKLKYNAICLHYGNAVPTPSGIFLASLFILYLLIDLIVLNQDDILTRILTIFIVICLILMILERPFNYLIKIRSLKKIKTPNKTKFCYEFCDDHISISLDGERSFDYDYSKIKYVRYNEEGFVFTLKTNKEQAQLLNSTNQNHQLLLIHISKDVIMQEEILNLLISKLRSTSVKKVFKFKPYSEEL